MANKNQTTGIENEHDAIELTNVKGSEAEATILILLADTDIDAM